MASAKSLYNVYGKEYAKNVLSDDNKRVFNRFYELPSMKRALGIINGKQILDVGCGHGMHIKEYVKKGAKCIGTDISATMIQIAKNSNPEVDFHVSENKKLPFADSTFDIVTSSLSIHYEKNVLLSLKEISRVLKKGGMFYFSTDHPYQALSSKILYRGNVLKGYGYIVDGNTRKYFGKNVSESAITWEMLPGMVVTTYRRTFSQYLRLLQQAGFELLDLIDCKPTSKFKEINPDDFERLKHYPLFGIYIARKK